MAHTASALATPSHVREHYDDLARLYRLFWGSYLHHGYFSETDSPREAQLALLDFCVGLLPLGQRLHVLDAGCGYGATTLCLAQRFRCRADGVSISPRQIKYARRLAGRARMNGRLNFTASDISDFTYPNAPYDLVWAMESTEHFPSKERFFTSATQALRPGGAMLVAAWTAGPTASAQDVREVAEASVCPAFLSVADYEQLMRQAGLTVLRTADITTKVARTWDVVESRVRFFRPLSALLPKAAREFSVAIPLIRRAFKTGILTYSVIVAQRPAM